MILRAVKYFGETKVEAVSSPKIWHLPTNPLPEDKLQQNICSLQISCVILKVYDVDRPRSTHCRDENCMQNLIERPNRRRQLWRHRCRWEDTIKMNLKAVYTHTVHIQDNLYSLCFQLELQKIFLFDYMGLKAVRVDFVGVYLV